MPRMSARKTTCVPELGDRVPRLGNALTRAIGRWALRLWGWRLEGTIPNRDKMVIIGAPHTTAADFTVGMLTILALGIRLSWLGIDWIPLIRLLGGVPIEPERRQDVVASSIARFAEPRPWVLGLLPEGSRKKVVPWKTGYYHIAHGAGVPLLLVAIDQQEKLLRFGPELTTTGDYSADWQKIRPFFEEYLDKFPDRFGM